ncbi:hypothetical protein H112_04458 [Trichophyton rubrum D6]|uniref:Uncharacterized protein n=3 Tax=Trichophyton rubrum TaxID=5551 RepID=A0A178F2X0_TRIRU|nr:uncharacterized protein TERG_12119 [Trichophyton rubrum CBS 118892]EZF22982.1 hypothetical protein H100_04467 [Trichophyton rubrum MR850]EZF52455.1 hypothetical protein H103_04462 [Trichophyton rubrum CBS 288.86]EZF63084.1 hypothetical protein H104_04450 [Trichophyton rubrum CBS 289.86]EZF84390.1 hypothetical protein H110_04453 [Trichophyton rubrum MR1448]EZF95183.1 hypothetical protein H113_04494 [Trichophyton rubrum MR1459]EZG06088.1 hypothetical protein H106_04276 [Trichophyton rubrum C
MPVTMNFSSGPRGIQRRTPGYSFAQGKAAATNKNTHAEPEAFNQCDFSVTPLSPRPTPPNPPPSPV